MPLKLNPLPEQLHHDGHGLTERLLITGDDRDPAAGLASHHYRVYDRDTGTEYARIQFQHGPRHESGSTSGILDSVLLAVLLDRFNGFQSGPYVSEENALVIEHLTAALAQIKARADRRAAAGTLGTRRVD